MILIVGGAGYIGSQVNKLLSKLGKETLILDDLSSGKRELVKWGELIEGNLGDEKVLEKIFTQYKIEAVLHFAAFKAVGESVVEPEKYYSNNVSNTLVLLKTMRKFGINKFIFSSSAAVFGCPSYNPIDEKHPQNPINPYGWTKLMVEQMLKDFSAAYGLKSVALRYFNASGADMEAEVGEWTGSTANLIPLVMDTAMGRRPEIKIFGTDYETPDGTCIRDYIHVVDLADAHVRALDYLDKGEETNQFNLGNGKGFSVREVIDCAKKISGVDFKVVESERRPGDPPILLADSNKAKEILGWTTKYPELEVIIKSAWEWSKKL